MRKRLYYEPTPSFKTGQWRGGTFGLLPSIDIRPRHPPANIFLLCGAPGMNRVYATLCGDLGALRGHSPHHGESNSKVLMHDSPRGTEDDQLVRLALR